MTRTDAGFQLGDAGFQRRHPVNKFAVFGQQFRIATDAQVVRRGGVLQFDKSVSVVHWFEFGHGPT